MRVSGRVAFWPASFSLRIGVNCIKNGRKMSTHRDVRHCRLPLGSILKSAPSSLAVVTAKKRRREKHNDVLVVRSISCGGFMVDAGGS